ncbi:MAG: Regulatory protein RecX [candidate division WS2 bacterium ADurb.Bin280]|uniref:Regulatory protein RecX n=1 Tax=candidate division WS2 bacterium ADurb.Bin280 TaxID=1852829 RepID=A0A1V5SEN3_9BACT|nr:MAG: Regulatory protein RecX [candidate division WS2 bacterium ADurb.Bin280]
MKYKRELPSQQQSRRNKIDEDEQGMVEKCFQGALYYLNRRDRTQKELEDKLRGRGFDDQAIAKAVVRLKGLSFIDDERFARNFVRNSFNLKPKGRRRLKFELKRKGLSEQVIENALQSEWTCDEYSLVMAQAKKIVDKNSSLKREKIFQRALGALIRRGFDYSMAKKAVLECLDELN